MMTRDGLRRRGIEETEVIRYDRSRVESGRHDNAVVVGVGADMEACSLCCSFAGIVTAVET